jgi:hypothetical protein
MSYWGAVLAAGSLMVILCYMLLLLYLVYMKIRGGHAK